MKLFYRCKTGTRMKSEFEKKLEEHGFSYQRYADDFYSLGFRNGIDGITTVHLICSEPVDESVIGSRNGNPVKSIGQFKIRLTGKYSVPGFLIFTFQNKKDHFYEYVIIPSNEFKRRITKGNRHLIINNEIEIVFWQMVDAHNNKKLYDCTNISAESEWFFLSLGSYSRMIDSSVWDYSEFLNNWDRLKMI